MAASNCRDLNECGIVLGISNLIFTALISTRASPSFLHVSCLEIAINNALTKCQIKHTYEHETY